MQPSPTARRSTAAGPAQSLADHFARSLRIVRDLDETGSTIWLLESVAGLATDVGSAEKAAQLLGFAESCRRHLGAAMPIWDRPRYERDYQRTKALLTPSRFDQELARGGDLAWENCDGSRLRGY